VSRAATLSQLRTDVQNQADIAGLTVRHTPALLNRLINQSIQRFRGKLSEEGVQHYLTNTTGLFGPGATSPYPFHALDLSAAAPAVVRVFSVWIDTPGETKELIHVPFRFVTKLCGPNVTGEPEAWANYQTTGLAIMPAPSGQYSYNVWHLPKLADLADDADTFDGVAGWEDYIVWDVVCRILVRDQNPMAYQLAESTKREIWSDILSSARRVTSAGGSVIGRDSFGEKLHTFGGGAYRRLPRLGQ
jgi:hypothetical protein